MTMEEILTVARTASPDAWQVVSIPTVRSWSHGARRSAPDAPLLAYLEPNCHNMLAVYKGDIDISLTWGCEHHDDYDTPWMPEPKFSDPSVSSIHIDLRFRGVVVQTWIMIYLDGARILIPTPDLVRDSDEDAPMRWYVLRSNMEFARRFAALVVSGDTRAGDRTEEALARIGIEIR